MKNLTIKVLFILFVVIFCDNTQVKGQVLPINNETGKVTFSEIVELQGETVSKDALYNKAKEWFVTAFKSANDVIQFDDKESGKIIGKGNFTINRTMYLTDSRVDFMVTIMVKDGRYKYDFTDFSHISFKPGYSGGSLDDDKPDCGNLSMSKTGWQQVKEQTDAAIKGLINDLKKIMEASSQNNENDW